MGVTSYSGETGAMTSARDAAFVPRSENAQRSAVSVDAVADYCKLDDLDVFEERDAHWSLMLTKLPSSILLSPPLQSRLGSSKDLWRLRDVQPVPVDSKSTTTVTCSPALRRETDVSAGYHNKTKLQYLHIFS